MPPAGELEFLQGWFSGQCDGHWEHDDGITIESLDNPGWGVKINLADTELEKVEFARLDDHRTEDDWIVCWVEERTFQIACGPNNLTEALSVLRLSNEGNWPPHGKSGLKLV